jgi:glycosyltransferase involved in cell wall biosynthesis
VHFIERTLRSVVNQAYPNLELIVVDAGSTDGTLEVLQRFEPHIARIVCERDRGQSDGINKAIALATGSILGWQNSDDVYFPGALEAAATALSDSPTAAMVSGFVAAIDSTDEVSSVAKCVLATWRHVLYEGYVLSSQGVFWRRNLHEEIGHFDVNLHHAMDADFWLRILARHRACFVPRLLGGFRVHPGTKTSNHGARGTREYESVVRKHGTNPASKRYQVMRTVLRARRLIRWGVSSAWTLSPDGSPRAEASE